MSILPPSLPDGEVLKRLALAVLETHRERLILRGRRVLLSHLLAHDAGTIDDVRSAVAVPAGVNPVLFGWVPGLLAMARIIPADGFENTTRRPAHARPVKRWRLIDAAAAVAWLATHPELPEPDNALDPNDPYAV